MELWIWWQQTNLNTHDTLSWVHTFFYHSYSSFPNNGITTWINTSYLILSYRRVHHYVVSPVAAVWELISAVGGTKAFTFSSHIWEEFSIPFYRRAFADFIWIFSFLFYSLHCFFFWMFVYFSLLLPLVEIFLAKNWTFYNGGSVTKEYCSWWCHFLFICSCV